GRELRLNYGERASILDTIYIFCILGHFMIPCAQFHAQIGQQGFVPKRGIQKLLVEVCQTIAMQARMDPLTLGESTEHNLCGLLIVTLSKVEPGLQNLDDDLSPDPQRIS